MESPSRAELGRYALLFVAMMALHQDFWLWRDARLVLGFLPAGLAYQVGYSVLASVVMWALVKRAWPAGIERLEHESDGRSGRE